MHWYIDATKYQFLSQKAKETVFSLRNWVVCFIHQSQSAALRQRF